MNCELIFYLARRTGANEDVLSGVLSRVGVHIGTVSFATNESELCYALAQSVAHSNLIFVVGGLCSPVPQNVNTVLSRALTIPLRGDTGGEPVLKGAGILYNPDGANGYVLESGRQAMVLLPDVASQISRLTEGSLLHYLCRKYGLTMRRQFAPPKALLNLEKTTEQEDAEPEPLPAPSQVIPLEEEDARRGIPLGAKIMLVLAAAAVAAGVLCLLHHYLRWF